MAATEEYENQLPIQNTGKHIRALDANGNPILIPIDQMASVVGELSYFLFSQFSNSFKHYHEIYRAKRIERKYPTGTCLPFMKKIFVTTEGNLLPCERICHNYIIGKVTDKVHINCEQIADMYNQYYDEISKQCCECYHINECKECFMQSQIIDNKIVCGSKMNKQEYKSYLSILISLLEENPDLFDSVNKMIFT